MNKRPKFFCEGCGAEVKQTEKVCHHCGKFFASVKCPSCGLTGDARIFQYGCPSCGYAVYVNGQKNKGSNIAENRDKKKNETDPLPWWIYLVSLVLTGGLFAFIMFGGFNR